MNSGNFSSNMFSTIEASSSSAFKSTLPLKKRAVREQMETDEPVSQFMINVNHILAAAGRLQCQYSFAMQPPRYNSMPSPASSYSDGVPEVLANEPLDLSYRPNREAYPVHLEIPFSPLSLAPSPCRNSISPDAGTSAAPLPGSGFELAKFVCGQCDRAYASASQYRAHVRRHESKMTRRYSCSTCDKCFVQRSSLKTHERIHSGEKPYKCDRCNDAFGDFSTYTKHKRTHTGEKPYCCLLCDRKFSQSGNMHRHLKVVHKEEYKSMAHTLLRN